MPSFWRQFVVLALVGGFADEAAGHRPLVDAEAQHHPDVEADAAPSSMPGMTKTCSAKKRESVGPPMMGPPSMQVDERAADQGNAAHDGGADAEAPVGVLIEAQHLAGEGHAEREQQQEDADDPGEFARKFVRAEEKDLRHVDEHDGDHEVRSPAVQRAQKPAERDRCD